MINTVGIAVKQGSAKTIVVVDKSSTSKFTPAQKITAASKDVKTTFVAPPGTTMVLSFYSPDGFGPPRPDIKIVPGQSLTLPRGAMFDITYTIPRQAPVTFRGLRFGAVLPSFKLPYKVSANNADILATSSDILSMATLNNGISTLTLSRPRIQTLPDPRAATYIENPQNLAKKIAESIKNIAAVGNDAVKSVDNAVFNYIDPKTKVSVPLTRKTIVPNGVTFLVFTANLNTGEYGSPLITGKIDYSPGSYVDSQTQVLSLKFPGQQPYVGPNSYDYAFGTSTIKGETASDTFSPPSFITPDETPK